jgi:hypothetical protein
MARHSSDPVDKDSRTCRWCPCVTQRVVTADGSVYWVCSVCDGKVQEK